MTRKNPDTELDTTSWMVPYGTLMMILMIFFVILYSFSRLDMGIQYEKALAKLQSTSSGSENQALKEAEIADSINSVLKEKNLDKFANVTINAHKVKIALTQEIVFESGKVSLKDEAGPALDGVADAIKALGNKVIVEGHTDNVPIRSRRFSSNWELSSLRAFSVVKYLIDRHGIDPKRLAAYGYGEFRPVADNSTAEGRAKNRRIEISILREKKA